MDILSSSIAGTFDPLYELLEQYRVDSLKKYLSISSKNRNALSAKIAIFYKDNLRTIIHLVNRSQGIVFNFDRYKPKWGQTEKIARKSAFYSDVSVILLSGDVAIRGQAELRAIARGKKKKIQKSVKATNLGPMVDTLLLIKPLVKKGIVIPMPGNMSFSTETEIMDPLLARDYNDTIERIRRCELESTMVPISLDKWHIKTQINEMESRLNNCSAMRPVNIYLPHLSNLSLDTIIGLREDNYDSFYRFQQSLRDFLNNSSSIRSESAFIEIARKVDNEVTEIESLVKELGAQRRTKGFEVGFGIGASALSFLVDVELAKYLGALLSSKSALDGLSFISNQANSRASIEEHKYYMAYVTKMAADCT